VTGPLRGSGKSGKAASQRWQEWQGEVARVTKVAKVTGEIKKARQSLFNHSKLKTHNSKLSVRKDGTNEIDEMDETNDETSCS
jgi:hypothetical protein